MTQRLMWPEAERYQSTILAAVLRVRAAHPGAKLKVGGDWAGPKTLFTDPLTAADTKPLADWLASELDVDPDRGITAWGLMVGRGATIRKHKHEKSAQWGINRYAGTYCVACPPLAAGSSVLTVYEPDQTMSTYRPTPGVAIAFPATTYHESAAHREADPRVMVAFSVP